MAFSHSDFDKEPDWRDALDYSQPPGWGCGCAFLLAMLAWAVVLGLLALIVWIVS